MTQPRRLPVPLPRPIALALLACAALLLGALALAAGVAADSAARLGDVGALPAAARQAATAEFEIQDTPTELTLRGVDFVDERHGWAVGGEGEFDEKQIVMRTTDGGETWRVVQVPDAERMESVDFVSRDRGWMVGVNGKAFRTDDGGETWTRLDTATDMKLSHVQFLDAQTGFISLAEERWILKTENGGDSFLRLDTEEEDGLSKVFFLTPRLGWAVGGDGVLIRTEDYGATWEELDFGTKRTMYGLHFIDESRGWIGGSLIFRSDDAGDGWSEQIKPPKSVEAIHFIDRQVGWAIGDEGMIMHTVDGGATWTREAEGLTRRALRDLAVVGGRHLWVVGTLGEIVHRFDPAYATPTPVPTDTPAYTPTPTFTPTTTPTPTPTPTPVGPWVVAGDPSLPILVGPGASRTLTVAYGNMPQDAELEATLEGAATFADGAQGLTRAAGPEGALEIEVRAAEGVVMGDAFTLRVAIGGVSVVRPGVIAARANLPLCWR